MTYSSDWWIVPAGRLDVQRWSFGTIKQISDLYDPKIFGPTENSRCACGKLVGEVAEGRICHVCGVTVFADALLARHQRMGKLDLACYCKHPCHRATLIDTVPVAPIAFRTEADGTPNTLGRKYEALVSLNVAAADSLPPKGTRERYKSELEFDSGEIVAALSTIVGRAAVGETLDEHSLLSLLIDALATGKPYASTLTRSRGYAVDFVTRL